MIALIEPLQTSARRDLGIGSASGTDDTRTNAATEGLSKVWRAEAADVLIQAFETAMAERWPDEVRNPIARALSKTGSADAVPALLVSSARLTPADRSEMHIWMEGLAARRWSRLALEEWLAQSAAQPAWTIDMAKEILVQ